MRLRSTLPPARKPRSGTGRQQDHQRAPGSPVLTVRVLRARRAHGVHPARFEHSKQRLMRDPREFRLVGRVEALHEHGAPPFPPPPPHLSGCVTKNMHVRTALPLHYPTMLRLRPRRRTMRTTLAHAMLPPAARGNVSLQHDDRLRVGIPSVPSLSRDKTSRPAGATVALAS